MDVVTTLPRHPLTREDLDALPDDGWRHELVDGALVMTPSPSWRHQAVVVELVVMLRNACPPDLRVLVAPFDVVLAPDTVVQPDVLVARRDDLTGRDLNTAPLLAVEVLSPSTRHLDHGLKRARYETAGCPAYWIVDPGDDSNPPAFLAWELRDGSYAEAGSAIGAESVDLRHPFPLRVSPALLVS